MMIISAAIVLFYGRSLVIMFKKYFLLEKVKNYIIGFIMCITYQHKLVRYCYII